MAFFESDFYYTQIDNTKIEKIKETNFKYTLNSYNKEGKLKIISFETTRELKNKAYLKLKYMITRGVISWEEIDYESIPEKIKDKIKENSN